MTVIFRLDEILTERGMNPRQLAIQANINYITILRIFHNQNHGITLEIIGKICSALDIPPGELFKEIK